MKRLFAFITVLLILSGVALAQSDTFMPVYSITGTVKDGPKAEVGESKIVFYKNQAELDLRIYTYDYVGAKGRLGKPNKYIINATSTVMPALSVGQTYKVATVRNASGYGAGPVDVPISGKGYDIPPEMAMVYGGGIPDPGPLGIQPPVITQIKFGDRVYFKHLVEAKEDPVPFYTSATPTITAQIEGSGTSGINQNSIKIIVNDGTAQYKIYDVAKANTSSPTYVFGASGPLRSLSVTFSIPDPLPDDENTVTIRASEGTNTKSTSEVCKVTVMGGPLQVIGRVLPYPAPYSPTDDPVLTIQYTLNKDANIDIFIISIAGETVQRIFKPTGEDGGSAGRNKVKWYGRNMLGEVVGNGIYVGTIVSRDQGKVLARFKITIVD